MYPRTSSVMRNSVDIDSLLKTSSYQVTQSFRDRLGREIGDVCASWPKIRAETGTYYFNDGKIQTLLLLKGSLSSFRGQTQCDTPVTVWITDQFPNEGPLVYVTPDKDSSIIPNHGYVDPDGLVHFSYLNDWSAHNSCINELLDICAATFRDSPPLYKRIDTTTTKPMRHSVPPSYNEASIAQLDPPTYSTSTSKPFLAHSARVRDLLSSCPAYPTDFRFVSRFESEINAMSLAFPQMHPVSDNFYLNDGTCQTLVTFKDSFVTLMGTTLVKVQLSIWVTDGYPDKPPIVFLNPESPYEVDPTCSYVDQNGLVSLSYLEKWNEKCSLKEFLTLFQVKLRKESSLRRRGNSECFPSSSSNNPPPYVATTMTQSQGMWQYGGSRLNDSPPYAASTTSQGQRALQFGGLSFINASTSATTTTIQRQRMEHVGGSNFRHSTPIPSGWMASADNTPYPAGNMSSRMSSFSTSTASPQPIHNQNVNLGQRDNQGKGSLSEPVHAQNYEPSTNQRQGMGQTGDSSVRQSLPYPSGQVASANSTLYHIGTISDRMSGLSTSTAAPQTIHSQNENLGQIDRQGKGSLSAVRIKLESAYARYRERMQNTVNADISKQKKLENGETTLKELLTSLRRQKEKFESISEALKVKNTELSSWLDRYGEQEEQDEKKGDESQIKLDDVIVAADNQSRQIFECVSEINAVEDVLYRLDKGLANNTVDLNSYLKVVRKLARQQFMAKALALKIREHQEKIDLQSRSQQPTLNTKPPAYYPK